MLRCCRGIEEHQCFPPPSNSPPNFGGGVAKLWEYCSNVDRNYRWEAEGGWVDMKEVGWRCFTE